MEKLDHFDINPPDLVGSFLLLIFLLLLLPEREPDDKYDDEDTEGTARHRNDYFAQVTFGCQHTHIRKSETRDDTVNNTQQNTNPQYT